MRGDNHTVRMREARREGKSDIENPNQRKRAGARKRFSSNFSRSFLISLKGRIFGGGGGIEFC